jgi:hypothetical protein
MRQKTKKTIRYTAAGALILLLIAIAVPNFLPARFIFHEFLTFKIRVADHADDSPVPKAEVFIVYDSVDLASVSTHPETTTDAFGTREFMEGFEARGVLGRSGEFDLRGRRLVVRASGYKQWERPLESMFGSSRDYYKDPRVISYVVALEKLPSNP